MIDLLQIIPRGRECAISRDDLRRITGMKDRQLRLHIKRLVRKGVPILSSCAVKGYWLSEDLGEIERFVRESDRRRATEASTIESLRRLAARGRGEENTSC